MRYATPALAAIALLIGGCGGGDDAGGGEPAAAQPTTTIRIAEFMFDPDPATVAAGTEITVDNVDAAPHTLTDAAGDPAFDTGTIARMATGSFTVRAPGSYDILCDLHPFMKAKLVVTD